MSTLGGSHTGNQSLFLQRSQDAFALTGCYTQDFRHFTSRCLRCMSDNGQNLTFVFSDIFSDIYTDIISDIGYNPLTHSVG